MRDWHFVLDAQPSASRSSDMAEVMIVFTAEAEAWAEYLLKILEASHKFAKNSIILQVVDEEAPFWECDLTVFCDTKCVLLLVTPVFLDLQSDLEVLHTFQGLLCPPHKVVAFLCGVSECNIMMEYFEHWDSWRKLHAEDEPSLYVSTILECIVCGAECEEGIQVWPESPSRSTTTEGMTEELAPPEAPMDEDDVPPITNQYEEMPSTSQDCLTVQPSRILCGTQELVYMILSKKLDDPENVQIEVSSEDSTSKLIPGNPVNEYTISFRSPDMPAGEVTLTLYSKQLAVCSAPLLYYTAMEELNYFLRKASDPLQFICQAFNITYNATEALDDLLTESLESRMPANGLKVFGNSQVEKDNMSTSQRNEELPTLLHFAAKYGLEKLTKVLLQCPGALQAYSVANRDGEYPNSLAQKSGFLTLRQMMDDHVEMSDIEKTDVQEFPAPDVADVYEPMSNTSQDSDRKYSLTEDIYESMRELIPEDGLYAYMEKTCNSEEAMLRSFFEVKTTQYSTRSNQSDEYNPHGGHEDDALEYPNPDDKEDPYNLCLNEQIYDFVDESPHNCVPVKINRPPAPIPRPARPPETEEKETYISRVFSKKDEQYSQVNMERNRPPHASQEQSSIAKTPGQMQLIALQEKVKMGSITINEAVQEFKAWQDRKTNSLRVQQDSLQRLRDSITRRHKERGRTSGDDLEITAPMQRNLLWDMSIECSVYESSPRVAAPPHPPSSRPVQRGTWQTGSTSSNSSAESNRLSTLSNVSYSSAEGEFEDNPDLGPLPPRPARHPEVPPVLPPPRVPPRFPECVQDERFMQSPARILPQTPPQRPTPPPPIPRRAR
ncbi:phosphoinositide 3-kinase adapter protein 1 [Denticeps clupeoides]|uniref:DBB domain-containing protein n=1 Tax=Denticeps clupeoides TaxID=299321 RepID=A0AAY4E489_9TELE|nr:phosphoinositide 3-kinase adapter protein 1 [Denticeps clupeoides]